MQLPDSHGRRHRVRHAAHVARRRGRGGSAHDRQIVEGGLRRQCGRSHAQPRARDALRAGQGSRLPVRTPRGSGTRARGRITDGGGSRAILEAIKPPFRQKRYGDGFIAGFNVARAADHRRNAAQPIATPTPVRPSSRDSDGFPWSALLFVPIGLLVAAAIFIRRRSGPIDRGSRQRGPSWPTVPARASSPFRCSTRRQRVPAAQR